MMEICDLQKLFNDRNIGERLGQNLFLPLGDSYFFSLGFFDLALVVDEGFQPAHCAAGFLEFFKIFFLTSMKGSADSRLLPAKKSHESLEARVFGKAGNRSAGFIGNWKFWRDL